jgi:hypothetical protein
MDALSQRSKQARTRTHQLGKYLLVAGGNILMHGS